MSHCEIDRLTLIRRPPVGDASLVDRLQTLAAPSGPVFLHADAVVMAAKRPAAWPEADGDASYEVCRTSWRRRFPGCSPAPPFVLSTLTRMVAGIAAGVDRIDSDGLGGACCSCRADDGPYLIEVAFAPDSPRQAEETVEWILAAASLELDAGVLFSGGGLAHLQGGHARAWRQFIDFDLVELHVQSGRVPAPLAVDAHRVGPAEAVRLRGAARQLVML